MRYCLGSPADTTQLWAALAFMPFGLFFDFFDGKVARWRGKSSLMGQELDSLADLVHTFHSFITLTTTNIQHRYPSVLRPPWLPSRSAYERLLTIFS